MNQIGERIKHKREQQGLQLNELAQKVGITSSALSQIEKSKSYPSLVTLKQIAEKLQTTVGELIGENEPLSNNPVFRKDESVLVDKNESGTELYLISQQDLSKQMDTFLIQFYNNSDGVGLFKHHSGQIFGYLLSGEIQFDINNESHILQPGDSIYFNGKRDFQLKNLSQGISKLICVSLVLNK